MFNIYEYSCKVYQFSTSTDVFILEPFTVWVSEEPAVKSPEVLGL